MATTVEAAFVLLDRASGPLRQMRREARTTRNALKDLGGMFDTVGSRAQAAGLGRWRQQAEQAGTTSRRTSRDANTLSRGLRNVDRSSRNAGDSVIRLGAIMNGLTRAFGLLRLPLIIGGFGLLTQAATAAGAGLIALVPKVADLAGVLATLPAAAGAAAQGILAVVAALGGVGDAMSAGLRAMQQSGGTAAVDRQRAAVDGLRNAHEGLMLAQRGVRDAQRNLNEAQRQALRNLTDMKLAAAGAALGAEGAKLALRRAKETLAQEEMSAGASDLDLDEARLGVRQARLAVREARVESNRARVDARRALRRGVEREPGVVDARRGVGDALRARRSAVRALADAQRSLTQAQRGSTSSTDAFAQAMADLSPQARRFVRQLLDMRPALLELRAEAGRDLFPALSRSLTLIGDRLLPRVGRIFRRTGRIIGQEAEGFTRDMTTPRRLADVERLGAHHNRLIRVALRGARNLASALVDVAIAARPFTNWLADTVLGWTRWARQSARAGRETGRIAGYLDRTRSSLEVFGSILHNVWDIFRTIGRAARPLGDDMWAAVDRATRRWADFLEGARGQRELFLFFERQRPVLRELGGLIGDMASALWRVGNQPGASDMIASLRRLVRPLEQIVTNMQAAFGQSLVDAMVAFAEVMAELTAAGGPFQLMLEAFTGISRAISAIVRNVPGASEALVGLFSVVLLNRFIRRIRVLRTEMLTMPWAGGGGMMPGGGGRRGGGTRGGGGPVIVPGGRGGGARTRGPVGPITAFGRGFSRGRAQGMGPISAAGRGFRGASAGAAAAGGVGAVLRGGVGTAARGAGRFFAPIAGLLAAMDFATTEGNFGQRLQGAASGATLGLIPRPVPASELAAQGAQRAQNLVASGASGRRVDRQIAHVERRLAQTNTVRGPRPGAPAVRMQAVRGADRTRAEAELRELRALDVQMDRERRARMRAFGQRQGYAMANSFGNAFRVYSKRFGPEKGMDITSDRMMSRMGKMRGRGARVMAQNTLAWAREMARGNPKLQDEVRAMEQGIVDKFRRMGRRVRIVNGVILTGSQREWRQIGQALRDPAERARQEVSAAFTAIQRQAVGSLVSMGFSRSQARQIVRAEEQGGRRHGQSIKNAFSQANQYGTNMAGGATGMRINGGLRIPGVGLRDTVPVAPGHIAAPGELVVNRHTEARQDAINTAVGVPRLGEMVTREGRPHSAPLRRALAGRPIRSHATGGRIVGIPGQSASIAAGLLPLVQSLIRRYRVSVSEGYATSGHATHSDHYWGGAVDLVPGPGGNWNLVDRLAALAEPTQDSPVYPFRWVGYTGDANHGRGNHLHLSFLRALLGGGGGAVVRRLARSGMFGAMMRAVKAPRSRLGGVPGALAQRAMDSMAAGMNEQLQAAGATGGPTPRGGASWNKGELAALARSVGMPHPELMAAIALAESSGNPRNVGPATSSGRARGLWQIMWPLHAARFPGMDPFNPRDNALMAKSILASQGLGAWEAYTLGMHRRFMETGGRVGDADFAGWFREGGQVTARRPTLVGLGEGGETETATITRGRPHVPVAPAAAGHSITIQRLVIENHRKGDIRRQMREELEAAIADLADLAEEERVKDGGVIE